MNGSSASAIGPSSRYTLLANNVSIVLSSLYQTTVSEADKQLMERAANLLRNIVQGSKFVELKDAHALSNPTENLFTVSHGIQALQNLAKIKGDQVKQITKTFEEYEGDLRRLSNGEVIDRDRVDAIAKFFDVLGSLFYSDIAEAAISRRRAVFERPDREDV
jgi:hypothetical protein